MRNNQWLDEKLYDLWENNFADVPRKNKLIIKFGKRARRTLGSIKYLRRKVQPSDQDYNEHDDKRITQITITRYFIDEEIPEYVVEGTIAHELVHYVHGFSSPLEQQFDHPHQGGVIKKEMRKRNLLELHLKSEKWIKTNWANYIRKKYHPRILFKFVF